MKAVPDITVVFTVDDTETRVNWRNLPLRGWQHIKQQTGFTPATLLDAIGEFDLDAFGALLYMERACTGDKSYNISQALKRLSKADEFDVVDIVHEGHSLIADDEDDDEQEGEEEDPTTSGDG